MSDIRHSEVVQIEVRDGRFKRNVGISYNPDDPGRLMFYVDNAGGFVISAQAFVDLQAALRREQR